MIALVLLLAAGDRHFVAGDRGAIEAKGGHVRSCPTPGTCIVEGAVPAGFAYEDDRTMEAPHTFGAWSVSTKDCGTLWELDALGAETVWAKVKGDKAPLVSVMDSGFRTQHPDLSGKIAGQWDYGEDDATANVVTAPGIVTNHGTFIMGVIGARSDNDTGRAGLAPSARIFAQKIADDGGGLYYSYAVEAMTAVANGTVPARIVTYSISSANPPKSFHDAVKALDDAGVILVAAASNCGSSYCSQANNDDYPLYPTSDEGEHVLSVASSGSGGSFNPYSHWGPESVDLAAPGMSICSLTVNDGTETQSGTSYAAPFAAAAAALVWEAHPDLTHHEVVRLVKATAKPSSAWAGKTVSGGVLDVQASIATPLVRVTAPSSTQLVLKNVAGAGEVKIVFFHAAGVDLERPQGVTARPFAKNDTLGLPGLARAPSPGTLWTLTLGEHAEQKIDLSRLDAGGKNADVSARVIVTAQALTLGAPLAADSDVTSDASGAPALTLHVPGAAKEPDPDPTNDPEPPLETPKQDTPVQDDTRATVAPQPVNKAPAPESSSGCNAASPSPLAGAFVVGVFLMALRRRRSR